MRDSNGNEVDCVIEKANETTLVEIKMSDTLSPAHFKNIQQFRKQQPTNSTDYVIYTGNEEVTYHNIQYRNWKNLQEIL
jgi:hypothetical protein